MKEILGEIDFLVRFLIPVGILIGVLLVLGYVSVRGKARRSIVQNLPTRRTTPSKINFH